MTQGQRACIEQMLKVLHAAHGLPPVEPNDWETKLRAWGAALEEVQPADFPALTDYILKHHKTAFMPAAGEALRLYEKMTGADRDGTANAAAYDYYKPPPRALTGDGSGPARAAWLGTGIRMKRGLGPVLCDCGVPALLEGIGWNCGNRNVCRFFLAAENTVDAPRSAAGPLFDDGEGLTGLDAPSYSEEELLAELYRVGFDTAHKLAVPFAHEMKARCGAPMEWTAAMAKATWGEWTAARKEVQP